MHQFTVKMLHESLVFKEESLSFELIMLYRVVLFQLEVFCTVLSVCAVQLVIKALHVRPDQTVPTEECMLKVSLQPLRLNVDQVYDVASLLIILSRVI